MGALWREAFKGVVGKRILEVVVAQHHDSPRNQVFLIFDDGTYYELYGADIQPSKNIRDGGLDEVRAYVGRRKGAEIVLDTAASRSG